MESSKGYVHFNRHPQKQINAFRKHFNYRIYNAETLEKLIKTVRVLHNCQSMYESLFAGQVSAAYEAYSQMHGAHSIQHYAVNSMLYLHTIKEKYIEIFNEFIS